MPYARIKAAPAATLASRAAVADAGAAVDSEEHREVERLRALNAHLMHEISVLREREAETQRLADRDGLTGLYNRRRMLELMSAACLQARALGECVGLLFIDLNGFKAINDEYGHAAGDKILTTVATRISARVRTADIVCRYGGDEFVVVLPSVPDPGAVSRVADSIRERVSLPYWVAGKEQHLTAAIGEALFPFDADTAEGLLHAADQRMYRLKSRLAHPLFSLGAPAGSSPARRRSDKAKSAPGGAS